jgi:hypothetical protein
MRTRLSLLATISVFATGCFGTRLFDLAKPDAPIQAETSMVTVTYESRTRAMTHWQVDKDRVVPFLKKLYQEDERLRDRTQLSAIIKSPNADQTSSCVACSWQQLELGAMPALNGGDKVFISHPLAVHARTADSAEPGSRPFGKPFDGSWPGNAK